MDADDGNERTSDGQQPRKEETGARKSSKGQQKENVSEDVDVDASGSHSVGGKLPFLGI